MACPQPERAKRKRSLDFESSSQVTAKRRRCVDGLVFYEDVIQPTSDVIDLCSPDSESKGGSSQPHYWSYRVIPGFLLKHALLTKEVNMICERIFRELDSTQRHKYVKDLNLKLKEYDTFMLFNLDLVKVNHPPAPTCEPHTTRALK